MLRAAASLSGFPGPDCWPNLRRDVHFGASSSSLDAVADPVNQQPWSAALAGQASSAASLFLNGKGLVSLRHREVTGRGGGGVRFRYENLVRDAGCIRGWVRVRGGNPGYPVRIAR